MSKKDKESPESDIFINIRRISADIEEHVDLINNLAEQLEASGRVSDDLEICKKFPDWKLKLKTRIICELTDSMMKFDLTLKSLSTIINELSKFFEERNEQVSESHEKDLIKFIEHLRSIFKEYSNFIKESEVIFDDLKNGKSKGINLKKRSLFEETSEIQTIFSKLRTDSRLLIK